ncbi:MAG TPA: hypothetical protein VNS02_05060 [Rhizobiaceae bacterium]|nr:hypothetical protein [Rhizobiaceae bacterium]
MTAYSLLLLKPSAVRASAPSPFDWSALYHVEATTPEGAFHTAQHLASADYAEPFSTPTPESFAVLAVFTGHLSDELTPNPAAN